MLKDRELNVSREQIHLATPFNQAQRDLCAGKRGESTRVLAHQSEVRIIRLQTALLIIFKLIFQIDLR